MKKILILLLFFGVIGLIFYQFGSRSIFSRNPRPRDLNKSIEQLEEEARDADREYKKYKDKISSSEKVGYVNERLGKQYLKRKDWTPAINTLTKALQYGRTGATVHHALGVAYANRGEELGNSADFDKAEHHYERAIQLNPKYYDALYGLAILKFYTRNDSDTAIAIVKKIISEKPEYIDAHFALGHFYYKNQELDKSMEVYEALYSRLNEMKETQQVKSYKKNCKDNINTLMMELRYRTNGK